MTVRLDFFEDLEDLALCIDQEGRAHNAMNTRGPIIFLSPQTPYWSQTL